MLTKEDNMSDKIQFDTPNDINVAVIKNNKDLLINEDCCTCINIILKNDGQILTSFMGSHNPYIVNQLEKAQKAYFKALKKALKHDFRSDDKSECDDEHCHCAEHGEDECHCHDDQCECKHQEKECHCDDDKCECKHQDANPQPKDCDCDKKATTKAKQQPKAQQPKAQQPKAQPKKSTKSKK